MIISFASEDAEPASRNVCEKNREKAKKERNKKKSKTDKESTEDVDLSEQEHTTKRVMPSSRNHLDDSRSRSQVFKRCYYLFSSLTHEA